MSTKKQRNKANWNEYYQFLQSYYQEHGNSDIASNFEINGKKVGAWLNNQKVKYRNHTLTEEQIQLLNKLEIKWNKQETTWNEYYQYCQKYYQKFGNLDIKKEDTIIDSEGRIIKLGTWLNNQRSIYYGNLAGTLTEKQIELLNNLQMKWSVQQNSWDEFYQLLIEYEKQYGNQKVPFDYIVENKKLGYWIVCQRGAYYGKRQLKISAERKQKLNEINFDWNPRGTNFLKKEITEKNQKKYQQVLKERMEYILTDLMEEGFSKIQEENQQELEKVIVKRMWK